MVYYTAMLADHMIASENEEQRKKHDDYLGLFTPILKGFLTETGNETANLGIQVRERERERGGRGREREAERHSKRRGRKNEK